MAAAGDGQRATARASQRRGAILGTVLVILTTLIASGFRSDGGLRCILLPGCADARLAIGFPFPFWERAGLVHPRGTPASGFDVRALVADLLVAAAIVVATISWSRVSGRRTAP